MALGETASFFSAICQQVKARNVCKNLKNDLYTVKIISKKGNKPGPGGGGAGKERQGNGVNISLNKEKT